MNKMKMSARQMKNISPVVLGIPYCRLQNVLDKTSTPRYYNSGVTGWKCDLYIINENISIVTGYDYQSASTVTFGQLDTSLQNKLDAVERLSYEIDDVDYVKKTFHNLLNIIVEKYK